MNAHMQGITGVNTLCSHARYHWCQYIMLTCKVSLVSIHYDKQKLNILSPGEGGREGGRERGEGPHGRR